MAAESHPGYGMRSHRSTLLRRLLRYVLLVATALVVAFPIYITVVNALLTPQQIAARPPTLFPLPANHGR